MRCDKYSLYQLIENFDAYGNSKNGYEFIENIDVYINNAHMKSNNNEVTYFTKVIQGVTKYNSFELGEKYKIINDISEYEITSFINGKLTQLQLTEVIL